MVKQLAIVALLAACLATAAGQNAPEQQPWGDLLEDVTPGDSRQTSVTTQGMTSPGMTSVSATSTASSLTTLLANLISNIIAPLLQNIATGITNAIIATFANRTLRYIPVPSMPEPISRLTAAPRPHGDEYDYPSFYREPSRRRPAASADSPDHAN